MYRITISGQVGTFRRIGRSVKGSVNTEQVTFNLDDSWNGLTIFACFKNTSLAEGQQEKHVLMENELVATIPWEMYKEDGALFAGVLGLLDGKIVKPTVWVQISNVETGVDPQGEFAESFTPSVAEQIIDLAQKAVDTADSVRNDADAGKFAGKAPRIAENGDWEVWDSATSAWVDTGVYSGGQAPYIGDNGNWFVGEADTGVYAGGKDGKDGKSGVYVGADPIPDGYNVQINPNGDADLIPVIDDANPSPSKVYSSDKVGQLLTEKVDIPATGSVGQVMAVKSVGTDGKPTDFECVNQSGSGGGGFDGITFGPLTAEDGWEQLADTTAPDVANVIEFNDKAAMQSHDRFFILFRGRIDSEKVKESYQVRLSMNNAGDRWYTLCNFSSRSCDLGFYTWIFPGAETTQISGPLDDMAPLQTSVAISGFSHGQDFNGVAVSCWDYKTREFVRLSAPGKQFVAGSHMVIWGRKIK